MDIRTIQKQLIQRNITNPDIIKSFLSVPRERFVPKKYLPWANEDRALSIGYNATISQPYTVAFMTQLLSPQKNDVILEVGTGSGYQSAILSKLVKKVYSMEIIEELAIRAKQTLQDLDIKNVKIFNKNGFDGLPQFSPYNGIIVTAGATRVPPELVDQLERECGRMVIPIGAGKTKEMTLIRKTRRKISSENYGDFIFIPLIEPPT